MGQSADAVMIAGSGSVHVAPVGTALPASPTVALNAAFVDLGYITEDGATFRDSKTREPVMAWQSFYPIKHTVTGAEAQIEFVLRQWDANTIPLAFGGGAITEPSAGVFLFTPPDPEEIDERAMVLDWQYDGANFRLVVPKVMVVSDTESQLVRSTPSDLPITLAVQGTPGASPWTMYSDHTAWDPTPV